MAIEILIFANFTFKISKTTTKVIVGERVQDEERFVLNWKMFNDRLKEADIDVSADSRPFFDRYRTPRPDLKFFEKFLEFQKEIHSLLEIISNDRVITSKLWESIFKESETASETVKPKTVVTGAVGEKELKTIEFEKLYNAETYRAFLFGQLRDLVVAKQIFRIKRCPECERFFYDQSKSGSRIFCDSSCSRQSRQRASRMRRAEKLMLDAQQQINFPSAAASEGDDWKP